MAFIDASPTPAHAVAAGAERLTRAGFRPCGAAAAWDPGQAAGPGFVARGGALVAWGPVEDRAGAPSAPIRLIGAHTDSPNLRIRPRPDTGAAGWRQLAVEVYGGALLNSWLDRDLGLAGRVAVRSRRSGGVESRLFRTERAVLRIPQLAIHLDRDVVEHGLRLDRQAHLTPVWALGEPRDGDFRAWLAGQVGASSHEDVLAWDVACFDLQPAGLVGRDGEFLSAARLDNLCSCYAALDALAAADRGMVVLFDHEEVGSTTATGAAGTWLAQVLERRVAALGGDRADLLRSLARSTLLSADMAHATHPNYPERHEPRHWIQAGGGPVIKHNVNARYATDAHGAAAFRLACERAGVTVQEYAHRGDLPCGSTIGPLAAAGLAVDTVDVGAAQLAMHSARELMATSDVAPLVAAFTAWLDLPADDPAAA
jgi:aspartyl aminopeptidase